MFSLGNLVNGAGRAAGTGLVGVTFGALERALKPPLNFAVGLAAFQVFFIPTGIMFLLAARSSPRDITEVQKLLAARAVHPHPQPHDGAAATTRP